MASLRTPTPKEGGQSVVEVYSLATVVTGDTINLLDAKFAFAINVSTNDIISAQTFAAGVLTITVANSPNVIIVAIK